MLNVEGWCPEVHVAFSLGIAGRDLDTTPRRFGHVHPYNRNVLY